MPDFDICQLEKLRLGTMTAEKLIQAGVTLVVSLVAARLLICLASRLLQKPHFDRRFQKFALAAVKVLVYIAVILLVADSLGIPVTSLVALVGVFGLALSLAVQDILSNVAGGMVILFAKPFLIGDYIESDAGSGTVASIDTIHTKLDTFDGQRVLVPNSKLSASRIVNYTRLGTRRIDITLRTGYAAPALSVRAACLQAVEDTPGILDSPAPAVNLTDFGENAVEYHLRCWTAVDDYWDSRYLLMERVKDRLEEAGIPMAYNRLYDPPEKGGGYRRL